MIPNERVHFLGNNQKKSKKFLFRNFKYSKKIKILLQVPINLVNRTATILQMFEEDDVDYVLLTISGISGVLSVLGSIGVMVFLCYIRGIFSNISIRLVAFLSIANIFSSLSYVIHLCRLDLKYPFFCIIEAILMDFFEHAAVFWCTCIIIHILLRILFPNKKIEKFEFLYHLISWGYPLIWVIILCIFNRYGWEKYW